MTGEGTVDEVTHEAAAVCLFFVAILCIVVVCCGERTGHHAGRRGVAPIPCTYLSPDTENDSCPIVREPVHVTFSDDRLSSPVALRSQRSQPIVSQVTCTPDRSQPHKVSASVVA